MPRHSDFNDAWDDDFESDDDNSDLPSSVDDEEPTIPCPYCRTQIHEDSQRCPHCENYVSQEDAPSPRRPWWLFIGVSAGLWVVYKWIVGG